LRIFSVPDARANVSKVFFNPWKSYFKTLQLSLSPLQYRPSLCHLQQVSQVSTYLLLACLHCWSQVIVGGTWKCLELCNLGKGAGSGASPSYDLSCKTCSILRLGFAEHHCVPPHLTNVDILSYFV
jgi:hypothetical protein